MLDMYVPWTPYSASPDMEHKNQPAARKRNATNPKGGYLRLFLSHNVVNQAFLKCSLGRVDVPKLLLCLRVSSHQTKAAQTDFRATGHAVLAKFIQHLAVPNSSICKEHPRPLLTADTLLEVSTWLGRAANPRELLSDGCASKMCTQNGPLVNFKWNQRLKYAAHIPVVLF